MGGARSVTAAGVVALLITLLASPSGGQDASRQRAPGVRVYSRSGQVASRYVTPGVEVSEDAYVFAVSLDLDGQIQILHPDFPGISVKVLQHKELRLPNFFAGFSDGGSRYDGGGRYISYADSYSGRSDSRGTLIALASRVPFKLDRVESDGDWDISAIRSLIEHRAPAGAAQALAAYIGEKGEPIGIDYMRFSSADYHEYYASTPLYSCNPYYGGFGPGLAYSRLAVLNQVETLRQTGQRVAILGYDFCGMPIVAYGPSRSNQRYRPHMPQDSGGIAHGRDRIPRGRSAQSGGSEPREAAIGTFPLTGSSEAAQAGEAFIPAPTLNRRDPRQIFNDPRSEALARESAERGRARVEHNAPPAETPVIGTFPPSHEYPRPILREAPLVVHEPPVMRAAPIVRDAPPPVYERQSSPPPIVREQPPSPPPPPPEARSKPVADPAPPPRR